MSSRTDDELLTSQRPEDFGLFYRRHVKATYAYLRLRVADPELAADLTAEVFAAALVARRRYRPGGPPARAWIFGIADNVVRRARRKHFRESRARARLGMAQSVDATPDEIERAEELADVARVRGDLAQLVADLPAAQREAVLARVVLEQEFSEIAARQAATEPAVRQRVSRGLARLALGMRKGER